MSQPGQNFDKDMFGNIIGAISCSPTSKKSTKIGTGQN